MLPVPVPSALSSFPAHSYVILRCFHLLRSPETILCYEVWYLALSQILPVFLHRAIAICPTEYRVLYYILAHLISQNSLGEITTAFYLKENKL